MPQKAHTQRICLVLLTVTILILVWCLAIPQSSSTCSKWSCTKPLIVDVKGVWPSPRPDLNSEALQRWYRLHDQHVAEAQRGNTRLVFLGDSITEGWIRTGFSGSTESVAQPVSEAIWTKSFGEWRPLNLAIGGDCAHDLGWRLQNGLLPSALDPDVFVVLIGTNDLGKGESKLVALTEVKLVLRQLHVARPRAKLLLVGLLPRGEEVRIDKPFIRSSWWTADRNHHFDSITYINSELAQYAQEAHTWLTFLETAGDLSPFIARAHDPKSQERE